MASLVQYTKVRGQVGKSRASGPALWPPWTRATAQSLWPQAPIQESLLRLSEEDANTQAVESFQGE